MSKKTNLDGQWHLTRSVAAGKEGASPGGTFILIKGDVVERHTPDHVFERIMLLDPSVQPHHIDLHITNEPNKGEVFLGIYKIEGDILTIAHSLPGRPRPTTFESTEENEQILSISQKQ